MFKCVVIILLSARLVTMSSSPGNCSNPAVWNDCEQCSSRATCQACCNVIAAGSDLLLCLKMCQQVFPPS